MWRAIQAYKPHYPRYPPRGMKSTPNPVYYAALSMSCMMYRRELSWDSAQRFVVSVAGCAGQEVDPTYLTTNKKRKPPSATRAKFREGPDMSKAEAARDVQGRSCSGSTPLLAAAFWGGACALQRPCPVCHSAHSPGPSPRTKLRGAGFCLAACPLGIGVNHAEPAALPSCQ